MTTHDGIDRCECGRTCQPLFEHNRPMYEHDTGWRCAFCLVDELKEKIAAWREHHYALQDLQWVQLCGEMKPDSPEVERECKARAELVKLGQLHNVMMPDQEPAPEQETTND